jgi:hypothetical protein
MIRLIERFEKILHYPNLEEVLEIIHDYAKDAVLVRVNSDEHGPYAIEMSAIDSMGRKVIYSYIRKGTWADAGSTTCTVINVSYPSVGHGIEGEIIAEHDDETGEWIFSEDEVGGGRWMAE